MFDQLGFNPIIQGMIDYIQENKEDQDENESDDEYYENRIKKILSELLSFLMESFNEKIELMFFFKTCFINFDLGIKNFRKILLALGKVLESQDDGEEDF